MIVLHFLAFVVVVAVSDLGTIQQPGFDIQEFESLQAIFDSQETCRFSFAY